MMESATTIPGNRAPGKSGAKKKDRGNDVIKLKPLKDNLADLLVLKTKADDARDTLADKVKAVAKQANLLPAVVRKLVNAKATDKFEKAARQVEQLSIVFTEIDGGQQEISNA